MVFNNTFTAAANANAAYKACIISAEQLIQSLWTNNITLNLTFDAQNNGATGNLASNSWASWVTVTYAQLKAALPAFDSLPTSDPNGNNTAYWHLPEAYARMLGLSGSTFTPDDTVTLNTGYSWSYGQDVTNTIIHEISEGAMGRVGGLGDQNSVWSTLDLFRFSAPGVRDFTD